jgi:hypothetical protein
MNIRTLTGSLLVLLGATSAFGETDAAKSKVGEATPPATAASLSTPLPPPPPLAILQAAASSDAQLIGGLREQVEALKAQTAEMRRSEDRLLTTVHWTMGLIGAIALALAGVGVYSARTFHDRDLKRIRDELIEELRKDQTKLFSQTKTEILGAAALHTGKVTEGITLRSLLRFGELERDAGLFNVSLRSGLDLFKAAQQYQSLQDMQKAMEHILATLRQANSVSKAREIQNRTVGDVNAITNTPGLLNPDTAREVRNQLRNMYPERTDL